MKQMRKHVDFKSVLIGVLGTMLAVVMVGANGTPANMGDIVVRSISIEQDDEGIGGDVYIYNSAGRVTGCFGSSEYGSFILTFNSEGRQTGYFGTNPLSYGTLLTCNSEGTRTVSCGTEEDGSGYMRTYNSKGNPTGVFGTE